ncbi:MAG: hypothetical protein EXS38_09815 [Opitutus sp.]|nr:hypothetical protein [Opitutus sp.]
MNHFLAIFLLFAAIVAWTIETMERTRLTARIDNLRLGNRALGHTREEHERLRRREPFPDELLSLRRDAAELAGLRREMADREQFTATGGRSAAVTAGGTVPFPEAQWVPAASWKNVGRATAQAALQTVLWAAAAGEPSALREVLGFSSNAPGAAKKLGASQPELPRASDPESEGRPVARLAGQIGAAAVQLLAEQNQGFDHTVVYLAVKSAGGEIKAIYLQLHRDASGWRVMVPTHVLEKARSESTRGSSATQPVR